MNTIIEAIYEGGLFRPVEKVDLQEGTHVQVRVPQTTARRDPRAVAARLNELAAQAPRRPREAAGRNHDRILYGEKSNP